MNSVIFIDYDNTIFSHKTWSIPKSALAALEGLKDTGYKVVVATGRPFTGTTLPAEFEGRFVPDCLVSSNGAYIEAEGHILWKKYFDPQLQKQVMDYAVSKNYCLMCGMNGHWYVSNKERFLEMATPNQRKFAPEDGEAFRTMYDQKLASLFLADTEEAILDMEKRFPDVKLLRMGKELGGADIIPVENGKVIGASRILDYYHTDFAHTAAIGDSMNDVELIEAAGFGVAMGNAMKDVQERADYVAPAITEDGLQDAIAHALGFLSAR